MHFLGSFWVEGVEAQPALIERLPMAIRDVFGLGKWDFFPGVGDKIVIFELECEDSLDAPKAVC
jgi:hypothetical protein